MSHKWYEHTNYNEETTLKKIIIEEEILDEFAPTEKGKVEINTVFKWLSKLVARVLFATFIGWLKFLTNEKQNKNQSIFPAL